MSETITLHAMDLSGETGLKMYLRKDDGSLLNTGGDAFTEITGTGTFQATLEESRVGLGTLSVRVCDGTETADNLLYDDFLPTGSTVIGSKVMAELDSASINAVADQIWDEAYVDHNIAGSFGKLLNTIRKANLTIDGTVSNATTPTTLTFASSVVATTSAYAHAVLLFVSGPLAGENSPIISYNSTNGVFVLEEALTAAPSDGDEFVVIAGSHVHAVADIQAGLARTGADGDTLKTLSDQIDGISLGGGSLTPEQEAKIDAIQDSIDAYVSGVTAAAVESPGTIVGFPASLNIGDSYTQDANSSITIEVVDENEDPVDTWGDYDVNTAGFAPELVITQSGRTGRVKATVTYDTDHFVVELPPSETRRAAPGVATMSFVLRWVTDGKIVAQRTITSAQAVTWNELI